MSFVVKNKDKPSWIRYIENRIRHNKNFIFLTTGSTGSGKSWTTGSIGEMLDKSFNVEGVIFTGKELMDIINNPKKYNLKKGSYILWDEGGVDFGSRDWQTKANKLLNQLFETFRHQNLIIGFTVPYIDFLDSQLRKLFHAEFQTVKIDYKKKIVRLKPVHIQYNSRIGKFYYKRLKRVNPKEGTISYIKYWDVPKPSNKFIKDYEEKKDKFTSKLNKKIGKELDILDRKDIRRLRRKEYVCNKCNHIWRAKTFNIPKRCPKCRNYDLNSYESPRDIY